jgi:hypothetical protein
VKVFLSYALSIVGLGVVAAALIPASAINLSYPAARLRMIQMIQMSINKAEVLCRTAKGTFYEPLGAAIKIGAMAQTNDITMIAASTKPGYDAACVTVTMYWKKLFGRGKLGAMMVAGGLAIAIAASTSPILHIIVLVLTIVGAAWFMFTRAENERSLVRARAEILPVLDQSFVDGKYTRY